MIAAALQPGWPNTTRGKFGIRVKLGHKLIRASFQAPVREGSPCWTRGRFGCLVESVLFSGQRRPTLFRTPCRRLQGVQGAKDLIGSPHSIKPLIQTGFLGSRFRVTKFYTYPEPTPVPLHDRALSALAGSAMALDVYAWLAQRLHRIEWGKRVFVPWAALKAQFGWHYDRMDKFKAVFRQTVRDVHSQYRAADIELDGRGTTLRHSPPPVRGRTGIVVKVP